MKDLIKNIIKEELTKNLTIKGKIVFDPDNVTRKHSRQADWKRVAMVKFDGEMAEYYAWFVERRYGLTLNRPLRGAHVTFVNDSIKEIVGGERKWEEVKKKWDGREIEVIINPDVRTNGEHWWLRTESIDFENIRHELGLGKPFFNYHMTIGYANERNIEQSEYILNLIQKFGGNYSK